MPLRLEKAKIYAYVYGARRQHTGARLGSLKATVEFGLKRAGWGGEFRRHLTELEF